MKNFMQDFDKHLESVNQKRKSNFDRFIQKYENSFDEDDIVDLRTCEIVEDHGVLRNSKRVLFGFKNSHKNHYRKSLYNADGRNKRGGNRSTVQHSSDFEGKVLPQSNNDMPLETTAFNQFSDTKEESSVVKRPFLTNFGSNINTKPSAKKVLDEDSNNDYKNLAERIGKIELKRKEKKGRIMEKAHVFTTDVLKKPERSPCLANFGSSINIKRSAKKVLDEDSNNDCKDLAERIEKVELTRKEEKSRIMEKAKRSGKITIEEEFFTDTCTISNELKEKADLKSIRKGKNVLTPGKNMSAKKKLNLSNVPVDFISITPCSKYKKRSDLSKLNVEQNFSELYRVPENKNRNRDTKHQSVSSVSFKTYSRLQISKTSNKSLPMQKCFKHSVALYESVSYNGMSSPTPGFVSPRKKIKIH